MKKVLFIIIPALVALSSCTKQIEYNGDYPGEKIVMYCNLNTESSSIDVQLYKSRFFLDTNPDDVYRGLKGATLSGTVNGVSLDFYEDPDNDGRFTTPYQVKPGDVVALKAVHPHMTAVSASATVPRIPSFAVDRWYYDKEKSEMHFFVTINDDASAENFYRIAIFRNEEDYEGNPIRVEYNGRTTDVIFMDMDGLGVISTAMGDEYVYIDVLFSDEKFNGKKRTIDVWTPPAGYYENPDDPTYSPTSGFYMELQSFSSDLYKYSKCMDAASGADFTGFFSEPVSIHNNIQGGIGCLGAVAVNRIMVTPEN